MIYYFSGTGNSREVAKRLAQATHDEAANIITVRNIDSLNNDTLGFVFPIYAWGLPRVMAEFIRKFPVTSPSYVYMVCTCGDDIGRTDHELRNILSAKGMKLDAAWSVIMPNTYIALPGFDVDPQKVTLKKLKAALPRVDEIGKLIAERRREIVDVHPGALASFKSYVLRPLFNHLLTGDHKFKVLPSCTHCGRCEQICPTQNIHYDNEGFPTWNGNCADCLACYHSCPQHAIQFGHFSHNKGQYLIKPFLRIIK